MTLNADTDQRNLYEKFEEWKFNGYVFHGSTNSNITQLEPRPAIDRDSTKVFNNDNAIFATNYPEAAILFAVMDTSNIPREYAYDKKG